METLNLNEMNEIMGGVAPTVPQGMSEAQDGQLKSKTEIVFDENGPYIKA